MEFIEYGQNPSGSFNDEDGVLNYIKTEREENVPNESFNETEQITVHVSTEVQESTNEVQESASEVQEHTIVTPDLTKVKSEFPLLPYINTDVSTETNDNDESQDYLGYIWSSSSGSSSPDEEYDNEFYENPSEDSATNVMGGQKTKKRWYRKVFLSGKALNRKVEKPVRKCQLCNQPFSSEIQHQLHVKMHMKLKPFACNICSEAFSEKRGLILHQRMHKKPLKCVACDKTFTDECAFKAHLVAHGEEEVYKCKMCGKEYNSKSNLTSHMKIHAGRKPYGCAECGKSFVYKAHLQTHLKIHNKDKALKCPHCDKVFSRQNALSMHSRIHEKEKAVLTS